MQVLRGKAPEPRVPADIADKGQAPAVTEDGAGGRWGDGPDSVNPSDDPPPPPLEEEPRQVENTGGVMGWEGDEEAVAAFVAAALGGESDHMFSCVEDRGGDHLCVCVYRDEAEVEPPRRS